MLESAKDFIKANWKYIIGAVVLAASLFFVRAEYQEWKQHIKDQAAKPATTVPVPQKIETKTEIIREVAVQVPSAPGAVLQVVERDGKIIAVVGDQEVEIPNQTGQPTVSLGDNGELRLTSATTTKIDVTDMSNAQARLLADRELAEQAKQHEAEMKKEKSSRNKERLIWIVGTAGGAYLLTK